MLTEATGLPVVTTARAMVRALQHEKAKRIAVVTPYQDAVNAQLAGVSCRRRHQRRPPRLRSARRMSIALGRITAEQVRDLARATMGPDCDALFIGCSQLPTHAILARPGGGVRTPGLVVDPRDRLGCWAAAGCRLRPFTG